MSEILHRGKRTDNGEWIDGYYVHLRDSRGRESHRIYTGYAESDCGNFYPDWFEVDPATVGQYTGLKDKNGKRIFERDVMEFDAYGLHYRGVVYIVAGNASVVCKGGSPFLDDVVSRHGAVCIGNIHDNPELLEGGGNDG